jgi:hypothetical protein
MVVTIRTYSRETLGVGLVDTLAVALPVCLTLLVELTAAEALRVEIGLAVGVFVRVILDEREELNFALPDCRFELVEVGH